MINLHPRQWLHAERRHLVDLGFSAFTSTIIARLVRRSKITDNRGTALAPPRRI